MSELPEPLITISPEYLSGARVFTGTRVPVQALFANTTSWSRSTRASAFSSASMIAPLPLCSCERPPTGFPTFCPSFRRC